jgi:hypothetical protein
MISIEFQDGWVFIHTARARVVLAKADGIQALRYGQAWRHRQVPEAQQPPP